MSKNVFPKALLASSAALILIGPGQAQELPHTIPLADAEYSPYPSQDFPNRVLFGDTHVHTAYSADAGLAGANLTPDDAFRYARGQEVISNTGIRTRLARPLDWLVVSDHAENLGLAVAVKDAEQALLDTEWGAQISQMYDGGSVEGMGNSYNFWLEAMGSGNDPLAGSSFGATMWTRATEAAERNNQPGLFTAIIGFEWTSNPDGNNLHRNILYRDGKDLADRMVPISAYDSDDPERLWDWMEQYEADTGGRLLAIPHNGNLSNGLMFDDVTLTDKRPIDAEYAARRARFEPVYEVTQIKGDGEAHPLLSPDDPFADYVTWDVGSFGQEIKTPDMLPREYAREALKRGLAYEEELGVNPWKFGMVGSSDTHTGLSAYTEDNFFGKVASVEPTAEPYRFGEIIVGRFNEPAYQISHWQGAAAGLAAVWSRKNTREAIWDAFARKEVYATTGTRMLIRVFGGFDFAADDLARSDFAEHGYANGVPMGGDLSAAPDDAAPGFLVRALRDPDGANLDRVQMVKGWLQADGSTAEKVYDIAWSGDREPGPDGFVPDVGNTVDAEAATYDNSIGAPFLETFWQDPDFDPAERAFYYVRVIEIPTPNWLAFDRKYFGVDLPEGAVPWIDERGYTTPIWYTPG